MRISLIAVHRLGTAPEALLAQDYVRRAAAAGRRLGLETELIEVEVRKSGKAAEAAVILPLVAGAHIIACDEHGATMTSRAFSDRIARLRDDGERRLALVIGGADGLDSSVLGAAHGLLAFGPQTWPHALARAMLAEQVYRAMTILGGAPYHRD